MAQLVVRNLDDDVKAKLQQRARRHGWSTEEEVREILRNVVRDGPQKTEPLGGPARLVRRYRARRGHPGMAWSTGKAGHILMILIDTNVLSAMTRVAVEPAVERWFDGSPHLSHTVRRVAPRSGIWSSLQIGSCEPADGAR
jgi:antitoxin FitA